MPIIKSLEDLKRLREKTLEKRKKIATAGNARVSVAMGYCSIAAGANDTLEAILNEIEVENLSDMVVTQTGCIGLCEKEPIVQVQIDDQPKVVYGKVSPKVARQIVREHLATGKVVEANQIEA